MTTIDELATQVPLEAVEPVPVRVEEATDDYEGLVGECMAGVGLP